MAPSRLEQPHPLPEVVVSFEGDSDVLTPESVTSLDTLVSERPRDVRCSATVTGLISRKVAKDPRHDLVRRRISQVTRRLLDAGVDGGVTATFEEATAVRGLRPGQVRVQVVGTRRRSIAPARLPGQAGVSTLI